MRFPDCYRCLTWDVKSAAVTFEVCNVGLEALVVDAAEESPAGTDTENAYDGDDEPQTNEQDPPAIQTEVLHTGQHWVFVPRTGRHKIYGELRPATPQSDPTTMCLSRTASKIDPTNTRLLKLAVESCFQPAISVSPGPSRRNCLQLWTLPRLNTSR